MVNLFKFLAIKRIILSCVLVVLLSAAAFGEDWTIRPGIGVGPVKLGTHISSVKEILKSKPEILKDGAETYSYENEGIVITTDEKGMIFEILVRYNKVNNVACATENGIKIGLGYNEVIKLMGEPKYKFESYYVAWPGIAIYISPDRKVDSIVITRGLNKIQPVGYLFE